MEINITSQNLRNKFIFLLFLLTFNINLFSQTILEKKVSIVQDNYQKINLLKEIENQSGAIFSYNADLIDVNSKINFGAQNQEIQYCLNNIFPKECNYKASGKYIILLANNNSAKGEQSKQKITVKGKIIGPNDNPIPNVSIYDINTGSNVITNEKGEFTFNIKENQEYNNLSIGKIGFQDTLLTFNPQVENNLKVILNIKDTNNVKQFEPQLYSSSLNNNFLMNYFIPLKIRLNSDNLSHISGVQPFQISLIPGLGTNFSKFGVLVNNVSINVLIGYSKGVSGVELASLLNFDKEDVKWLQLAGLSNFVGGNVTGIQAGGISNLVKKDVNGTQFAGITNFTAGKTNGGQASGILNVNLDNLKGFQFGGIGNISGGDFQGIQGAGVFNLILGNTNGVQASGVINFIKGKTNGTQVAGVMNTCLDTINGGQVAGVLNVAQSSNIQIAGVSNIALESDLQISGVLNVSKNNKGIQIAPFNICDTSSGVSLGILSYVHKGYLKPILSADEIFNINANLHMGTEKFYNIFNFSFQPNKDLIWGFGYGFGHKIRFSEWAKLDLEALAKTINYQYVWNPNLFSYYKFSTILDFRIKNTVSVYFGPSVNFYFNSINTNTETVNYIENSLISPIYEYSSSTYDFKYWLGFYFALSL